VTYTYDGNHHVLTRTDAKSQQTQYTYDSYQRLVETRHYAPPTCQTCSAQEVTFQRVDYTYDVNLLSTSNYSWGARHLQQVVVGAVFGELAAGWAIRAT
jgi:YD repeat-containing protein